MKRELKGHKRFDKTEQDLLV